MVFRDKDGIRQPAALIDSKWDDLKTRLLTEMHSHEADTKCYRDTTIPILSHLYKNKCAYCERSRGTELQVDHYRPKKTRDNKTNIHYNQPGYYWLAYTWSNLIPLCFKCNLGKSNKFPLSGWNEVNRVDAHINTKGFNPFFPYDLDWLQNQEQPLLINPEYERNPERHFIFLKNGSLRGRTDEGRETINICQLNRKDLRRERVEIRQGYVIAIQAAFNDFSRHQNQPEFKGELMAAFKGIKRNIHKDEAHSLFHLYLYRYFDFFIGSFLPANLRQLAIRYFNDFKARY